MKRSHQKMFKPGDYAAIIAVLVVAVLLMHQYFANSQGRYVLVTGKSFSGRYSLEENRQVRVDGPLGITRVVIKEGEAWVGFSPCKQKICVKMGRISRAGEQIVCLPNRVIVEVKGGGKSVDATAR
ncbi:MAG: NusG domain II-containing protein [Spirochaetota bacterium]